MHPYRPLHVAIEGPDDESTSTARPLAIVMLVLGLMRIVPALWVGRLDFEVALALAMFAIGLTMVVLPIRMLR